MIVQVAGIRSAAEARLVLDAGADLLGFPQRLDHHAPDVSEAEAAALIAGLGCGAHAVCITYEADPAELQKMVARLGVRGLQLHGRMDADHVAAVRRALGSDVWLARSVVVGRDPVDPQAIRALLPHVDALLTDTHDPHTGASGATGQTHDWAVSRELVRLAAPAGVDVLVAGGLTPTNVAEAIRTTDCAGVDAHTGLEDAHGDKDPAAVRAFVQAAKKAARTVPNA